MREGREQGRRLWGLLEGSRRWSIGDELVLGTFVWSEWFEEKQKPGALAELDRLRILWEEAAHGAWR